MKNQTLNDNPIVRQQYCDDEISLIDLWLVLARRKKLFIAVFLAIAILGLLIALMMPKQYGYVTSLEIGSRVINGNVQPIESPQTVLAKLQESYIPFVLRRYLNDHPADDKTYDISAAVPKGSQLVVLKSKDQEKYSSTYIALQSNVVDQIQNDHKRIIDIIRKELENKRNTEINKLEELKDTARLLEAQEKRISSITELLKKQIDSAKKDLDAAEKDRKRSVKEATNEAKAMTLLMLNNEVQQHRERLAKLEERLLVEVANNHDKILKDIADNGRLQQDQQDKIDGIKAQITNLVETRALVPPMQSVQSEGLSKRAVFGIAILLGLFLAIFSVFTIEFLVKASEQKVALDNN